MNTDYNRKALLLTIILMGVFAVLSFCIFSESVNAEVRLNVSFTEYVTRNVSFAKNFTLEEDVELNTIIGYVNVSNPSNETVYDIFVDFQNTANIVGNMTWMSGRNGTQYSNTSNIATLHIPELRMHQSSLFNYSVDATIEILNLTTDYSLNTFSRKVLAGDNFTIRQYVTNQLSTTQQAINSINITMETQGVTYNNTWTENFTFAKLYTSGDWTNVSNETNRTWHWTPNGGILPYLEEDNITFVISTPASVPSSYTYLMLKETLAYSANTVASNISLKNITAKMKVGFNVTKQIIRPSNNNKDHNVTWESVARVGVPYSVSYRLKEVDVWVTSTIDPNVIVNDTVTNIPLNRTYKPNSEINETLPWSNVGSEWIFNYTDGSGGYPPPIVWMKPEYELMFRRSQIVNYSQVSNATDLYMKYIYVIAGYWLQIEKNITSIGDDEYRIYIDVRNIGNAATPQNLTVTVFDMIPNNFKNTSMTPNPVQSQDVTGSFNGTVYQWAIDQKSPSNASLYKKGDLLNRDKWNATYNVSGFGEYQVSQLYIVGLDPRQVDGAFGSPLITIIVGLQTYSKEILYLGIVLFLVILNITNLLVSTKINRKIDKKIPFDAHKYHQLRKEIEHLKNQIK
ncbi:hypothetical protein COV93_04540 [Candidatus Woesearchaeota archaeon CG11_big_fil_rev_8_21_14_0_20_43_8]|nr:MAG: hypothetical protein COV93_04540 [Candidatus Woesearchaeota archaeon CG11_big_fil_rev_8_21_14_0_20_43_8]